MKALGKLAKTLAPKMSTALEKIGVDVKKLELELQNQHKKPTAGKIPQIKQLNKKDELKLKKELESVGINEAATVEKLLSIINPPPDARVETCDLLTFVVTSVDMKAPRRIKGRKSRREK
jgi:hypothetical protein